MLKVNKLKFEILGKVKFINVKVNLLPKTPPLIIKLPMPPPRAIVSKTNPSGIKEPSLAQRKLCAACSVAHAVGIYVYFRALHGTPCRVYNYEDC